MLKKMIIGSFLMATMLTADAQLKTPAASPTQTVKQDFGISNIELTYSRPAMKGRKIFGDLVPYGKVWRTGANNATRIKFADDVTIGGKPLPAGDYAIYTIPNKDEWEIIINKGITNWGTVYKQDEDVLRFKVKADDLDDKVENFTIQFENIKPNSLDLGIMWDETVVRIPIVTNIDAKIMAQISEAMKGEKPPYFQAAMYYMDNGKDLNQALVWFDKAVETQPNAFWMHHQRANALAKLGKKEEARKAAQRSMELAKEQKNDDYVKLNEKLLDKLK